MLRIVDHQRDLRKAHLIPFFRTTYGKPLCSIVELIAVTFAASIFTMPIALSVFGELSFAQIASIFGKTEAWARVTYHRAKLKIQERMGQSHE